jgi:molybdopterin-synthase adenylyltransferase
MLSPDELTRFARHIVLRHIGGPGQQRLRAAKVLVVGAGGLGSPLLLYLAAAGVGTLGDIGRPKVESAGEAIRRLDPGIAIIPHRMRLDARNAAQLVADYDVIADGSDNFDTRYLLAEVCEAACKPLVHAAVNEFHGAVTVLRPWEVAPNGTKNPRYTDLYPEKPPADAIPTCAQAGVLGALVGLVGSLQAIEVIRQITPFGTPLVGRLLMIDALDMRFETIEYARD